MRFAALLLLLSLGCDQPGIGAPPEDGFRVLFVGNSLTYTNDLPAVVNALLPTVGDETVYVGTVAGPNVSLEDHWNEGSARREIASGNWDVVVMQQGPSTLPESQAHLATWASRFADEARASGMTPALLTVWPPGGSDAGFDAVITSYANAAAASTATLLPAGAAWHASRQNDDPVDLYGPDGFHPSVEGTYLAALVVAAGLGGRSATGLPTTFALPGRQPVEIDPSLARRLQARADAALAAD